MLKYAQKSSRGGHWTDQDGRAVEGRKGCSNAQSIRSQSAVVVNLRVRYQIFIIIRHNSIRSLEMHYKQAYIKLSNQRVCRWGKESKAKKEEKRIFFS